MGNKPNYIKWLRSKVGHEKIILIFAGGCVFNDKGEVLLQKRADSNQWGFPGGAVELGETPQMKFLYGQRLRFFPLVHCQRLLRI